MCVGVNCFLFNVGSVFGCDFYGGLVVVVDENFFGGDFVVVVLVNNGIWCGVKFCEVGCGCECYEECEWGFLCCDCCYGEVLQGNN